MKLIEIKPDIWIEESRVQGLFVRQGGSMSYCWSVYVELADGEIKLCEKADREQAIREMRALATKLMGGSNA